MVQQAIDAMAARIDRADGLAGALVAGWDAFELIRAAALRAAEQAGGLRGADRADGLFAAFMLASAAAANGRDVVGFAPSLPPDQALGTGDPGDAAVGCVGLLADALAELASALRARLLAAAGSASGGADRAACRDAAREAENVRAMLARDG